MSKWKIDGAVIPCPSTYEPIISDLSSEESGRSTNDGIEQKDIINTIIKLNCSWNKLNWAECAALINAVTGKPYMKVTYPDPRYPNTYVTRNFTVGDRTTPCYSLVDGEVIWKGAAFNFIGVGDD